MPKKAVKKKFKKKDVNKKKRDESSSNQLTLGQRYADWLTHWAGSWTFILSLFTFLLIWMYLNAMVFIKGWDPYPFILLNLVLSCLAAIQAPIILMSQNRQQERDRIRSEYDYAINRKSEREIQKIQKDLQSIRRLIREKK